MALQFIAIVKPNNLLPEAFRNTTLRQSATSLPAGVKWQYYLVIIGWIGKHTSDGNNCNVPTIRDFMRRSNDDQWTKLWIAALWIVYPCTNYTALANHVADR